MTMNRNLVFVVAMLTNCGPEAPTDLCKGRLEGDLVITEVMLDPEGIDSGGEWIEFFNTLDTPLELKGLTLYTHAPDGSGAKTHSIRSGTAPARGYFVVGDVRSGPNPAWINYGYADGLGSLPNPGGVVGLRCGAALKVAEFTWTKAAKPQSSRMLDSSQEPTTEAAAAEANYCDTPAGNIYSGANLGTPGAANPACVPEAASGTCRDDGGIRPVTPPQPGDLVFTEWHSAPRATTAANGEYIEAMAKSDFDLNGTTLLINTTKSVISSPDCLRATANSFLLFGRNADPTLNGGLPPLTASFSAALTGTSVISLLGSDGGVYDTVSVDSEASGVSTQVVPGFENPIDNDSVSNRCRSPNRWNLDGGGDYGSPGEPNPPCAPDGGLVPDGGVVSADVCFDTTTQVSRPVLPPADGSLVITEWMPSTSAVSDTYGEYFEVLAKTDLDLNGVALQVGTSRKVLSSPNCIAVPTGTYLVFGRNQSSLLNGNLPPLTEVFTGTLTNTAQAISVLMPDGGVADSISYTGATASGWPSGASMQVRPGAETPSENDLPSNHCVTPLGVQYGPLSEDGGSTGDRGTPGVANVPCP